ncbi:unannotated protein [freshwater metagenome]|uniref:Unannotated protein n=1 Tax=freshwater metagenome TaxID=449393 RepID=A0A6J7KEY9_9ZZZZ
MEDPSFEQRVVGEEESVAGDDGAVEPELIDEHGPQRGSGGALAHRHTARHADDRAVAAGGGVSAQLGDACGDTFRHRGEGIEVSSGVVQGERTVFHLVTVGASAPLAEAHRCRSYTRNP